MLKMDKNVAMTTPHSKIPVDKGCNFPCSTIITETARRRARRRRRRISTRMVLGSDPNLKIATQPTPE